jgi:transcriptional regulator with XRE-family HTH domain
MTTAFGTRLPTLRQEKGVSQNRLATAVGVHFTYETGKLNFALYPGADLVTRIAAALDANDTESLLLAKKVPRLIRERLLARLDDFRKLAALDDAALDEVIRQVDRRQKARP